MKKNLRLVFGVAVSVVFLYLAVRGLDLKEVVHWLAEADYYWLFPAIAIYFVGVWGRTWRWHYMLRPIKVIPLIRLFPITCIGYMGNNVFPARAGEVLRAYVLKRSEDVSMSSSLAMIVVERVFDGLVMLLFVFIALPFAPVPSSLRALVIAASGLFLAALLVFITLASKPGLAEKIYERTIRRFLSETMQEKVDGFIYRFMEGLYFFRNGSDVIMVFVTSVFIWLAETFKYWFIMQAFVHMDAGFPVPFFVLMLMNGIVNLATTLPSAPGYIGTFDAPGVAVLEAYGVRGSVAFGYTIVLHAALWVPITLLGVYFFRRARIGWNEVDTARVQGAQSTSSG
ncbi:MAG: flippase-like domain-containing protein [Anaerolineae bacterium]|nr:flippase-like domain-containing protein [Anaerolineae bacterium]MCB0248341.1 flippase-like domain-containing protein [Anaerolineae bacterium]MCB9132213.1 flippase-like domain-containing protein [Anaerolineales bacterium]